MKYVGLTDNPAQRKADHGNPRDWNVERKFNSESEGRLWELAMVRLGYKGGPGGPGWHYGYTYTITPLTTQ